MKTKAVTRNNNNYLNINLNSELGTSLLRGLLRLVYGKRRIDPYQEARKTIRVYKRKAK